MNELKETTKTIMKKDGEGAQNRDLVFVTLGYSMKSGRMAYANPHAETEEGRAFLLLCNQKVLKKRDFQRYVALSRRAKK